jgi:hypothetical protein
MSTGADELRQKAVDLFIALPEQKRKMNGCAWHPRYEDWVAGANERCVRSGGYRRPAGGLLANGAEMRMNLRDSCRTRQHDTEKYGLDRR